MDPLVFLEKVWSVQPKGFGFVSLRSAPASWRDAAYRLPEQHVRVPDASEGDIYFSPNVFRRPRRRVELTLPSRWLFADLDAVDPIDLPDELSPTVAWESSPQRYQGLWLLPRALDVATHQAVNKRLTYAVGADKGGWDATQVLRLPGTQNHKYEKLPDVLLLWFFDEAVSRRALEDLPPVPPVNRDNGIEFEIPKELTARQILRSLPPGTCSAGIRSKLQATSAVGDRSRVLYRIEMTLLSKGVPPGYVFLLLKDTVWNKFDSSEQLKADIGRAAARVRP